MDEYFIELMKALLYRPRKNKINKIRYLLSTLSKILLKFSYKDIYIAVPRKRKVKNMEA